MAKDNKTVGGVLDITKVTDENIVEQIKNANKFSSDIVKAASEKAEKDEKDRQIREFTRIKDKATYINLKSVLRTRRDRAAEKATSEMRKKSLELLTQVSEGKMTASEYEEALDKAVDDTNEAVKKANQEFDKMSQELRSKFPSSYGYDWDDPYRRIRTDAR
jgi:polyribonucleotide nucleotidyltransferase